MERRSDDIGDSNSLTVTAVKGKVSSEGITKNETDPEVMHLAVSQTHNYFAVGTSNGFAIIQNDGSKKQPSTHTVVLDEPVCMIEMMYRSNFIALVFANERNKVIIWDDYEKRTRTEVSFHSDVRNLKLSKDMLVVAVDEKVFVFNFEDLKCIDQIETFHNPNGIMAISQGEKAINKVVACPHEFKGMLKVHIFCMKKSIENIITAHEAEIGALAINSEGTLIASASVKGTLIRIISVEGGDQLQELRRGSWKANINYLTFHPTLPLLACCSDRKSVHVFEIKKKVDKSDDEKRPGLFRTRNIKIKIPEVYKV